MSETRAAVGRTITIVALTVMGVTSSRVAAAQTQSEAARAEKLFTEASALIDQKNYVEACPKLEESQRIDPALGTQFNLALCYEKVGKLSRAWWNMQAVEHLAHATGKKGREDAAHEKLVELRPRVSHLVLTSADADATVQIDGEAAAREAWSFYPLEPGDHTIEATAPGKKPWQLRTTVPESTTQGAEVAVAVPALVGVDEAPKKVTIAPPPPSDGTRTLAFVAGGVGAAGLVTAIVTGILILNKKSVADEKCTPKCVDQDGRDAVSSGKSLVPVNVVSWGVAVAGLGVGGYLFFTSQPKLAAARWSPVVNVGAGSASMKWSF
jgi:hypothetical protein